MFFSKRLLDIRSSLIDLWRMSKDDFAERKDFRIITRWDYMCIHCFTRDVKFQIYGENSVYIMHPVSWIDDIVVDQIIWNIEESILKLLSTWRLWKASWVFKDVVWFWEVEIPPSTHAILSNQNDDDIE